MFSAAEAKPEKRAEHWALMEMFQPEKPRLIFIDESGINIDMVRLFGWGPIGERVKDVIPRNTPKNHSIIGALGPEGVLAAMEIEGAIDGPAFLAYVEKFLAPELRKDDLVLLDNNATHSNQAALDAIMKAGAWPIFLPAYSPDFNPIEQCWAKVKQSLRTAAARTTEALHRAFKQAIEQITPENAKGWFQHCGYWVPSA